MEHSNCVKSVRRLEGQEAKKWRQGPVEGQWKEGGSSFQRRGFEEVR